MKKLQILGMGCANCANLAAATEEAAATLGLDYEIEKVTDLNKIMSFGVMMTPALVVDGKVKAVGRVPSVEDIQKLLV
jgi:small redox-active disulfide protein 2